jgi:hypothetical protein
MEAMEESKEVEETKGPEEQEIPISKEFVDFNYLITTLIDYYESKAGLKGEMDEGEEWKEGTKFERPQIPKKINDAVEMAFLHQLKKFC